MDWTNSALTALFIASVYALIRVVNYFISKNKKQTDDIDNVREHQNISTALEKSINSLSDLSDSFDKLNKNIDHLVELHDVYTSNRVPVWYMPEELLALTRDNNTMLKIHIASFQDSIGEISDVQGVLVEKISELINLQKLMTERLGDLLIKLNNR